MSILLLFIFFFVFFFSPPNHLINIFLNLQELSDAIFPVKKSERLFEWSESRQLPCRSDKDGAELMSDNPGERSFESSPIAWLSAFPLLSLPWLDWFWPGWPPPDTLSCSCFWQFRRNFARAFWNQTCKKNKENL